MNRRLQYGHETATFLFSQLLAHPKRLPSIHHLARFDKLCVEEKTR